MTTRPRVILEPELEGKVFTMNSRQRRALAKIYRRWVRQLEVSANILEQNEKKMKAKELPWLHPKKAALN